jgi:hypothetical protein
VASFDGVLVALVAPVRRAWEIGPKQSFDHRRSRAEPPRRGHSSHPLRTGTVWPDARSVGQFICGYLISLVVSVSLGCMAIADGLALPWSAAIAVLVRLGIHSAVQVWIKTSWPHGFAGVWSTHLSQRHSRRSVVVDGGQETGVSHGEDREKQRHLRYRVHHRRAERRDRAALMAGARC